MKEGNEEDVLEAIMDFFADNPSPPDDEVHKLAEKLGLEPDDFEAKIYSVLGSILGTGKSKKEKFTEKDADPKELKMGIKVEMEHTKNKTIAKRIALDHLAELPDYYTRLLKMEGKHE
jgi:hypothetical protein